jgi:hypothetical protein
MKSRGEALHGAAKESRKETRQEDATRLQLASCAYRYAPLELPVRRINYYQQTQRQGNSNKAKTSYKQAFNLSLPSTTYHLHKMAPPSKLAVATSSVNRLVKEEASYHKELEQQGARIQKLESGGGDENADFQLRQEVCASH